MSDGGIFFALVYLVVFVIFVSQCSKLAKAVESIAKSLGSRSDDKPKD